MDDRFTAERRALQEKRDAVVRREWGKPRKRPPRRDESSSGWWVLPFLGLVGGAMIGALVGGSQEPAFPFDRGDLAVMGGVGGAILGAVGGLLVWVTWDLVRAVARRRRD